MQTDLNQIKSNLFASRANNHENQYKMKFNRKRQSKNKLEMWANAQRDGRPAEHRRHPLFNAAKFG